MKRVLALRLAGLPVGCAALATLLACKAASPSYDEHGEPGPTIRCGVATSLAVFQERAVEECPGGYTTLAERGGFNRREIPSDATRRQLAKATSGTRMIRRAAPNTGRGIL